VHYVRTKTEKGLSYISWAFIAYLMVVILTLILTIVMIVYVTQLWEGGMTEPQEQLGPLFALMASVCGVLLLVLAVVILFLVGFGTMYSGREEFGPQHSSSVGKSLTMLILAIVFGILVMVVGMAGYFSAGVHTGGGMVEITPAMALTTVISMIIGIGISICAGLMLVFLINEIIDPNLRRALWAAFALGILSSIVSTIIGAYTIYTGRYIQTMGLMGASGPLATIAQNILSFISIIFFFYCFRRTYLRVKNREILPIWERMHPAQPEYGTYVPPPI